MCSNREWTQDEVDYLRDKWGLASITSIARALNRSVNGVRNKARRIGLRSMMAYGDYITLNQFMKAFSKTHFEQHKFTSWVEKRGFPLKYKTVVTKKVRVVYIDEFWNWAEKNRDFVDFSKLEKNILGAEPDWVKAQRRLDIAKNRQYITTPWTEAEDAKLKYLLGQFRYTYDELSRMMRRTYGAIQRRIRALNINARPLPTDNHSNPWTNTDFELLKQGIVSGYSYELLADKLGRGSKAIRSKVYVLYHTENLDKVREMILFGVVV